MNPRVQPFISERRRRAASMKNARGQGQTWSGIINLMAGEIQVTTGSGVPPPIHRRGFMASMLINDCVFLNKRDCWRLG